MARDPNAPPPLRSEVARAARLRTMKLRATGLLVAISVAFVLLAVLGEDRGVVGYLQAAAAGGMVGGLADWFAVTALFRHPLGIPIPHTAVIVERKEQFGQTLGEFVQENFLSPDVIAERMQAAQVVERAAAWMSEPENADRVAEQLANVAVGLSDAVRDEDVQGLLQEELARGVDSLPLASLAGGAVRMMTADGRHDELLDALLRGVDRTLEKNREVLRARFASESPWWLPGAVDDRIFDRLYDGVCNLLRAVNEDPDHELRFQFEQWLRDLADRLDHSPELTERVERLKRDVLEHPELRDWSSSLWTQLKETLRTQAAEPESELRRRLAAAVVTGGQRLQDDPELAARLNQSIERAARYLAEHFQAELTDLVSGTIARWDADETARRLELLLGPDLQFIRINGTVVGALAAVVIHAISEALG
jgi:uncharacterized membrane-anchored protein YjiN (DUF445 family)